MFCLGDGCTLGAEKIFCGESAGFLVAFWGLLLVLYGALGVVWRGFVVRFNIVCGAVLHGLRCASVLVSVMFSICRGALRETKFQEKKTPIA
jgi:hypothetical protein